ncbi:hypothetical protein [Caulobacter sp. UNC279MFTsu5.1]|uniref:hypothetical protein n=1 Tax=Caulobacter sp. UNC279MFTsu5.1 TaxID=1502775 RepID=UPI0003672EBF|nr:hypothetical protein [Caulobacter sp. UNC279MFTsu5.1]SFJ29933.1 hypothetical protein SAMN02799626_01485 [Caulobacter sp. UNC279MFTsu5.1]
MSPPIPHLGLIYSEDVPAAVFDDFVENVSVAGLDLVLESREPNGPFAGMEWLIPTGVMLFIAQGYFSGLLGEMGKDHYSALKAGIKGPRDRFSVAQVTVVGSPGKASEDQPYSLFYSIYFEDPAGRRFKFLAPNGEAGDPDAERAMDAFGDFLEAAYGGSIPLSAMSWRARRPMAAQCS